MKVGEIISFGNWQWIVIEEKEDKICLLSKDILFQQIYNKTYTDITWENSSLREYLNSTFYESFSDFDREKIVKTLVKNNDNEWYSTTGGNDTEDYVYLLSIEEITTRYFGDSSDLLHNKGKNQRYWFERKDPNNDKRKATYLDCVWWYWLRSPGRLEKSATYIHGDGNIGMQGNNVGKNKYNTIHKRTKSNVGGVRPVLWIKNGR